MHQNVTIAEREELHFTSFMGDTRDLTLGVIFNYPLHDLTRVSRDPKVVDGVAVEWCPLARLKGKLQTRTRSFSNKTLVPTERLSFAVGSSLANSWMSNGSDVFNTCAP